MRILIFGAEGPGAARPGVGISADREAQLLAEWAAASR
jgi:hypothetical protein